MTLSCASPPTENRPLDARPDRTREVAAPSSEAETGAARPCARRAAERLLRAAGEGDPRARYGDGLGETAEAWDQALATMLMDRFRRTASDAAFGVLVDLVGPDLTRRARSRVRAWARHLDPGEVVQDVLVNVYRYHERFDAARPGAFRAWSAMILDNVVKRQLRRGRGAADVQLRPTEILSTMPDAVGRQPSIRVQAREDCRRVAQAWTILLGAYLQAYAHLNERERFVLQMVELHGLRYADVAAELGIRPEALKMVVFRARRRILDSIGKLLEPATTADGALAA